MKRRNILAVLALCALLCLGLASCDILSEFAGLFESSMRPIPSDSTYPPNESTVIPDEPDSSYSPDDSSIPEPPELELVWIVYDMQGGSPLLGAHQCVKGEPIPDLSNEITKEGYAFLGWYFGDELWDINAPVTQDVTLTARWEIKTLTVTYSAPEGEPSIMTEQYPYGSLFPRPTTIPVREGYALVEWHLGDEQYDFTGTLTEDVTLTAKWAPLTSDDLFTYSFHRINDGPGFHLESYGGEKTDITLPESYLGYPVTEISRNAFKDNTRLTSVYIPDTIKEINYAAFEGCTSLTDVRLPEGLPILADYLFKGCVSLEKITIPSSVKGILSCAFSDTKLTHVDIPDGVEDIASYAFAGCRTLTKVNISKFSALKNVGDYAFQSCIALTSIHFPTNLQTVSDSSFEGCLALQTVTVDENNPHFALQDGVVYNKEKTQFVFIPQKLAGKITIPEGVTAIPMWSFHSRVELTEVVLPEGLTEIGDAAFDYCIKLEKINIPDSVTSIRGMAFDDCAALTEITLPQGITTITLHAFNGCASLTELVIPEGVTTIEEWAFAECTSLERVQLPESLQTIGKYAFYKCASLKEIELPDGVTTIEEQTFAECTSLERAQLPASLQTIGKYAFISSALKELDLPDTVISIGDGAFRTCTALTEVKLGKDSNLEELGDYAFDVCENLQTFAIPAKLKAFNRNVFGSYHALQTVTVDENNPNFTQQDGIVYTEDKTQFLIIPKQIAGKITVPDGIKSIPYYAFNNCLAITEVTLPEGLTKLDVRAFSYCSNLAKINIPSTVTEIGASAFYNCSSLTEITLPKGLTTIENELFEGCASLKKVVIPEGVTTIEAEAFQFCRSLTELILPDGVTTVGGNAFDVCSKLESIVFPVSLKSVEISVFERYLKTVYFRGTPEEWAAVDTQNAALQDATVYYYSATQPTDTEHSYWRYVDGNIEIWNVA